MFVKPVGGVFINYLLSHSITDSFKHTGSYRNKTCMSESLNHSLKRFIQTHWFIQEENMYERVIESLTQTIHSNTLVHTGIKHVWASHWITHSNDSFKHIGSYRKKTCMSESLNHSLKRFIQTHWYRKKTCMSESLNHSLKRFIQTHRFIQEENMYERVIESLTQTIHSNTLVHTGRKHVWASHWITHSNDSFKHIGSYRKKTCMSESLNHSLKRFIQTHWFIQE